MELSTNVKTGDLKITASDGVQPAVTATAKVSEPDLVTRVSQFKEEVKETKPESTPSKIDDGTFDLREIDKITDPVAKEYAEKAYKSFQRDYTRKTQEIAETRKIYEQKLAEQTKWSPTRVQQLLNDPEFIASAQEVAKQQAPTTFNGTPEEWSGLPEEVKVKFGQMEQKVTQLERQNFQTLKVQQDESLKQKYTNYNPEAIDILTSDLLSGKAQATREHLWKVSDYDDAIRRAYELGKQDRQAETKQKVSANSIEGITTTGSSEPPKQDQGESNQAYWRRIFLGNLAKVKAKET